jgi:steroid delta-isomerase-like uncharacterized protein
MVTSANAENKEIVRRFFEEVVDKQNFDAIDQFVAQSAENKCGGNILRGRAAWRDSTRQVATAFPDMKVTIEEVVTEGDLVAVRWRGQGTHRAEFMGIPATGKVVPMSSMELFRLDNGQITEAWAHPDTVSVLQTLGQLR